MDSFLLVKRIGVSVALTTLAAGLLVGNSGGKRAIAGYRQGHMLVFWEFAAFLASLVIFLLIGAEETHRPRDRGRSSWWWRSP